MKKLLLILFFPLLTWGQFNPIFFSHPPEGLFFQPITFLDASDVASYPGSGTTWTDLKGFQNCTLTNGPTFNASNGGSLQFDGVDDVGLMGSAFNYTTQNFSFSIWVYVTSLTTTSPAQGPVLFFKGIFGVSGYYCQISNAGAVFLVTSSPSSTTSRTDINEIVAGNWYNITTVKRGSSVRVYINGKDKTTTTGSHSNITSSSDDFALGAYRYPSIAPSGVYSNIRIAKFQAYNKALSFGEVLDNFKTYKSIYGL